MNDNHMLSADSLVVNDKHCWSVLVVREHGMKEAVRATVNLPANKRASIVYIESDADPFNLTPLIGF